MPPGPGNNFLPFEKPINDVARKIQEFETDAKNRETDRQEREAERDTAICEEVAARLLYEASTILGRGRYMRNISMANMERSQSRLEPREHP